MNSLYLRLLKLDATFHHDCLLSRNVLVNIESGIFSDTLTLTIVSGFSVPGMFFFSGVSLCRDVKLTFLITMQVERLRIQGEHLERSEQIQ